MSVASKSVGEPQSNGRAILTMCTGIVCLVLNDAMAKWLTAHYDPLQIIFLRNLLALPMIAAMEVLFASSKSSASVSRS